MARRPPALLGVLLLAGAAGAWAQSAGQVSYAWWDTPVVKDLNLSADQTARVRATVQEYRARLINLHAAVRQGEREVDALFNAERFDARQAGAAVDRLSAARGELARTLAQMSLKLRAVLTLDQWRELQRRRPTAAHGAPAAKR